VEAEGVPHVLICVERHWARVLAFRGVLVGMATAEL
jgi:hypothetical protein